MKEIIICFFLLLCKCDHNNVSENKELDIRYEIIERLESKKPRVLEGCFYSIKIDIVNNTDSVIRFWIMTCSWQENFIFNNRGLYLYNEGCDSNVPNLIEIEGRNKISFRGVIHVNGSIEMIKRNNLKLGFILIKEMEVKDFPDFRRILNDKLAKGDVIW